MSVCIMLTILHEIGKRLFELKVAITLKFTSLQYRNAVVGSEKECDHCNLPQRRQVDHERNLIYGEKGKTGRHLVCFPASV